MPRRARPETIWDSCVDPRPATAFSVCELPLRDLVLARLAPGIVEFARTGAAIGSVVGRSYGAEIVVGDLTGDVPVAEAASGDILIGAT